MITMSVWSSLLIMTAVLLVPALPAVAVYKLLPDQRVLVTGTFAGFRLNATGAFGGYVFLVIVAWTIVKTTPDDTNDLETWTINGNVRLADTTGNIHDASITLFPPAQTFLATGARGRFQFLAPIRRTDGGVTAIHLSAPPYADVDYPVRDATQSDPLTKQTYRVTRDAAHHIITIQDTIVLTQPHHEYQAAGPTVPRAAPALVAGGRGAASPY